MDTEVKWSKSTHLLQAKGWWTTSWDSKILGGKKRPISLSDQIGIAAIAVFIVKRRHITLLFYKHTRFLEILMKRLWLDIRAAGSSAFSLNDNEPLLTLVPAFVACADSSTAFHYYGNGRVWSLWEKLAARENTAVQPSLSDRGLHCDVLVSTAASQQEGSWLLVPGWNHSVWSLHVPTFCVGSLWVLRLPINMHVRLNDGSKEWMCV